MRASRHRFAQPPRAPSAQSRQTLTEMREIARRDRQRRRGGSSADRGCAQTGRAPLQTRGEHTVHSKLCLTARNTPLSAQNTPKSARARNERVDWGVRVGQWPKAQKVRDLGGREGRARERGKARGKRGKARGEMGERVREEGERSRGEACSRRRQNVSGKSSWSLAATVH
eukprot:14199-Pleurochrysis_carterae.AAC.1